MKKRIAAMLLYSMSGVAAVTGCGGAGNQGTEISSTAAQQSEMTETVALIEEEATMDDSSPEETDIQAETSASISDQEAGVDETNDAYIDFASSMASIYGIRPGSAGTSLRAESAAEEFINFAKNYGPSFTEEEFGNLMEEWLTTMEESDSSVRMNFGECFDVMISEAESEHKNLDKDLAFWRVADGIIAVLAD